MKGRVRSFLTVFLVAGLGVEACGASKEATDSYADAESFCEGRAKAECDAVAASCAVSAASCVTARQVACMRWVEAATEAGRVYKPVRASACITKVKSLYETRTIEAERENEAAVACEAVFEGALGKGEPCTAAHTCEGSLACDEGLRVCAEATVKKSGDPCNNPGESCEAGFFCKNDGTLRVCTARGALGATCKEPEAPCREDLRCSGTACVPLVGAAEPCEKNEDCSTRFCNASQRCQARLFVSETGTCADFGAATTGS